MIKVLETANVFTQSDELSKLFTEVIEASSLDPLVHRIFGSLKGNKVTFDIVLMPKVDDVPDDTHVVVRRACEAIGLKKVSVDIDLQDSIIIHVKGLV